MRDRSYLLKVLGVSGLPKVATFGLSLATLPIVLRNVGASQYGTYLYVLSAVAICEVLIDFGISSAAGRRLSEIRASRPEALGTEIVAWARLQAGVLAAGFVPMVLIAQLALANGMTESSGALLAVVAATLGVNVALSFLRPCLQSLLAFKSMSGLDTFESVVRSVSQLAASQLMPSALGLAVAGFVTAAAAGALAVLLMRRRLLEIGTPSPLRSTGDSASTAARAKLRESVTFLWLRIATRLFQELPLLLIGRSIGPELVGIIGAFRRVAELLNTPYLIIGNALMVRVLEIRLRGEAAMLALWDAALRIVSTAVFVAALFHLAAGAIGAALLPAEAGAPVAFRVLAPLIFTASLIGVLAPVSDYLGALATRNVILSAMALLQVPILWLSIRWWGGDGALVAYVVTHVTLAMLYFALTHRTFFGVRPWSVRREVVVFAVYCAAALLMTRVLDQALATLLPLPPLTEHWRTMQQMVAYSVIVGASLAAGRGGRRYYFRRDFLDFTR